MQFNRKDLLSALRVLDGMIGARTVQPVLGCVIVSPHGTVRGTDLDMYLSIEVPELASRAAFCKELCTPVKPLIKLLAALNSVFVYFDEDSDGWKVAGHVLESMDCEDMPRFPEEAQSQAEVTAGFMSTVLDNTMFCIRKNNGHSILSAVDWKGGDICATDGSRLSHMFAEKCKDSEFKAMMDSECLKHVRKLVRKTTSNDIVHLGVSDNRTMIKHESTKQDGWTAWLRNIAGEYPPYHDLFPKREDTKAVISFDRDDMMEALKLIATGVDKRTDRICFEHDQLSTVNDDKKPMRVHNPCEVKFHSDIVQKLPTFGVNVKYLMQALDTMGNTVTIDFQGPLKPLIFNSASDYRHLLMPIQYAAIPAGPKGEKQPKAAKNKVAKVAKVSTKKQSSAPSSSVGAGDVEVVAVSSATKTRAKVAQHNPAPPPQEVTCKTTKAKIIPTRAGYKTEVVSVTVEDVSPVESGTLDQLDGGHVPAIVAKPTIAPVERPAHSPCYHTSRTCNRVPCALAPSEVA